MRLRLKANLARTALAVLLIVPALFPAQQSTNGPAQPEAAAPPATPPKPENAPNTAPENGTQVPSDHPKDPAAPVPEPPSTTNESAPAHPQEPTARQSRDLQSTMPGKTGVAKPTPSHKNALKKKTRTAITPQSKTKAGHHPKVAAPSSGEPGKVVVRNGGTSDAAISLSPGGTEEQEVHSRENTTQLLATTDQNLKRVATRQLTASEQNTVDQIRSYVRQAKTAADAGDLARAHTLAFKAHLLSDDLAKR